MIIGFRSSLKNAGHHSGLCQETSLVIRYIRTEHQPCTNTVLDSGNVAVRKQTWPLALKKLRVYLGERQIINDLINKIITIDCMKCIKSLEKYGEGDLKGLRMRWPQEELGKALSCRDLRRERIRKSLRTEKKARCSEVREEWYEMRLDC